MRAGMYAAEARMAEEEIEYEIMNQTAKSFGTGFRFLKIDGVWELFSPSVEYGDEALEMDRRRAYRLRQSSPLATFSVVVPHSTEGMETDSSESGVHSATAYGTAEAEALLGD